MSANAIDGRVDRWREYVLSHGATPEQAGAAEITLRDHAERLGEAGLDEDEAFLVALKRVAIADVPSRGFARSYAQESLAAPSDADSRRAARGDLWVMSGCALVAALAVKAPDLLGVAAVQFDPGFYARNAGLLVLPALAAYFAWRNGLGAKAIAFLVAVFTAGAVFANAFPQVRGGVLETLTATHLPVALWLAVGVAFAGGDWRSDARRMDYVRFTGEWLVNYALIALGGGVLTALTIGIFEAIGVDAAVFTEEWLLPCGAAGAVVVAAWLALGRKSPVGGMAPMLARVFTPLFALMLSAVLVGVVVTRGFVAIERDVLILFDVLLVVVLALLLYVFAARASDDSPGLFDRLQIALVGSAIAVDALALVNIALRLGEYGLSPNRLAALGLNLLLLVNLVRSAVLQLRFVRGAGGFEAVERWQTRYVPVYALWAAFIVFVFPLIFPS